MTTLVPDLDASRRLLAELRGDPRTSDDDTPCPAYIERLRGITADIAQHAANPEDPA